MEKSKFNRSRQLSTLRLAGTVLALGLLFWLLLQQDWTVIRSHLNRLPVWIIVIGFLLYLIGQVLNAWRWHVLLRAQEVAIKFGQTLRIVFAGAFASNFLPTTIGGDVLRLVSINAYTGNQGMSLASLVLDRLVNLAAFITVAPFSVTVLLAPRLTHVMQGAWFASPILTKLKVWLVKIFRQFLDAYKLWANKPVYLIRAFVISWFSIFVIFLALWLMANGLGIVVRLDQVMGITAMTYLITLLPISINGYGLRELVITYFYMRLGASAEQAAIFALLSRFLLMAATLPGAIWLGSLRLKVMKSP
jgi:hypothetical protein